MSKSNNMAEEYSNTLKENDYNELINEEPTCAKYEDETNLLLIGKSGCGQCDKAVMKLSKEEIKFEYKNMKELTTDKFNEYKKKAMEANNLSFPIIITKDENKSITVEEALQYG